MRIKHVLTILLASRTFLISLILLIIFLQSIALALYLHLSNIAQSNAIKELAKQQAILLIQKNRTIAPDITETRAISKSIPYSKIHLIERYFVCKNQLQYLEKPLKF